MRSVFAALTAGALLGLHPSAASSAETAPALPDAALLGEQFATAVRPLLQQHCLDCHGPDSPEAELSLSRYDGLDSVTGDFAVWMTVLQRLEAGDMPPADSGYNPSPEQRRAAIEWVRSARDREAARMAGDPGQVLARRLSAAEYNYTIRDLTGVDIQPAREFPVDPANQAGFDNTGESLSMSPALLRKYLGAARLVAEHLVIHPDGFTFASHPVVSDTDRDKYCVRRIVDFYERQPTDLADYFYAAWEYELAASFGMLDQELGDFAASRGLPANYLSMVHALLTDGENHHGPIATLRGMWQDLPSPQSSTSLSEARRGCEQMRDFVVGLRAKLQPDFDQFNVRGIHAGSQSFVMYRNRGRAGTRRECDLTRLHVDGTPIKEREPVDPRPEGAERRRGPGPQAAGPQVAGPQFGGRRRGAPPQPDPDLQVPADPEQQELAVAAFKRFCDVFPSAFYIKERGRDYVREGEREKTGRLLSAGFHSMTGFFRDDQPLCELILTEDQRRELDAMWDELDFFAGAPSRQLKGLIWFERTDSEFMNDERFFFARAEDKDITNEEKILRLGDVYAGKAVEVGAGPTALAAINHHFAYLNERVRWVEATREAAAPSHLQALLDFASRAYRRPLSPAEQDDLLAFYHAQRTEQQLDHEQALQDALVSVLVSPKFCYRYASTDEPGSQPLTDHELASRLSYFLWSSMPDGQLRRLADAGELHRPEVLIDQAQRMTADPRARGLAVEFGGNWLDFRRFGEHNGVDRERFPQFTDELREAMFEEPVRYLTDLVQRDGSVLDLLHGEHTFVNQALAAHYGIDGLEFAHANDWRRVDNAQQHSRGGLLPMAVFLTKNAPGLRTSPVKRGNWVVQRLLGERIPPPPPNVPELPADEAAMGELTLRDTLAKHRDNPACASCHERIDSIGLVFEGFGPVGELREVDLGGRPVSTHAEFPGGGQGDGVAGLRAYVGERRQAEFVDNLCRKLLSYALGRTLILPDELVVRDMKAALQANDYRFSSLLEVVVTSPQFLNKRGQIQVAQKD